MDAALFHVTGCSPFASKNCPYAEQEITKNDECLTTSSTHGDVIKERGADDNMPVTNFSSRVA